MCQFCCLQAVKSPREHRGPAPLDLLLMKKPHGMNRPLKPFTLHPSSLPLVSSRSVGRVLLPQSALRPGPEDVDAGAARHRAGPLQGQQVVLAASVGRPTNRCPVARGGEYGQTDGMAMRQERKGRKSERKKGPKHHPSIPSIPFNTDRSDQFGLIVYRPSCHFSSLPVWSAPTFNFRGPSGAGRRARVGTWERALFERDTNLAYRKRCGSILSSERVGSSNSPQGFPRLHPSRECDCHFV